MAQWSWVKNESHSLKGFTNWPFYVIMGPVVIRCTITREVTNNRDRATANIRGRVLARCLPAASLIKYRITFEHGWKVRIADEREVNVRHQVGVTPVSPTCRLSTLQEDTMSVIKWA